MKRLDCLKVAQNSMFLNGVCITSFLFFKKSVKYFERRDDK